MKRTLQKISSSIRRFERFDDFGGQYHIALWIVDESTIQFQFQICVVCGNYVNACSDIICSIRCRC